jgi:hypothetical protein
MYVTSDSFVESRMRGNTHVRFGGGGGKTRWPKCQKGRPAPILRNPHLEYPLIEPFLEVLEIYSSPSQQIYTFRGADWERLSSLLPEDMSIRTLRENYRSTPEIVRSSKHLAGPDAVGMIPTRDSLGIPVKIYKSARDSTARTVYILSAIVRDWERKGIDPG